MRAFYSEHFRTVEINYTFRRLPTASVLETWAGAVPADFQFVLKAPDKITHVQRLMNAGDAVANFLEMAGKFKERLGPLLFQLPPTLQKDAPRLRAFLALLPVERRVAFAFPHPSWFDDEVFGLLREQRAALCIADAAGGLEVPVVAERKRGQVNPRAARGSPTARELDAVVFGDVSLRYSGAAGEGPWPF
jgi:uncharacterized protein YecE (DUF72 family)